MITLYDILTDLTYGEFQHLKIGNLLTTEHESEPDTRAYAQFTSNLNKALTAIHTAFPLRFQEVDVQLNEEITDYYLTYAYASSNTESTKPVRYIMDTEMEPFEDNVLKIEEVYTEIGELCYLNDVEQELSVFSPQGNKIQVPWPNDWNIISVQYRAGHPKIVYEYGMDPREIELEINEQFIEPLLFYVASRMQTGLPDGVSFWSKYQNRVKTLKDEGVYPQAEQSNKRFENKGFV